MPPIPNAETHVGSPRNRVDGRAKVTGAAQYSAEFGASDLAHGYVVSGAIAKGRIKRIDTAAARAAPGVLEVFTHENRPRTAWFSRVMTGEFSSTFSLASASIRSISSSLIGLGCEKSKRSRSGATSEPFCATCVPSRSRKAACSRWVAE